MSTTVNVTDRGPLLGVYLSKSDFGEDIGNLTELSNKLAGLSREQVIKWITMIGMHFGPASGHSTSQQIALAKLFLPKRYQEKLRRRWSSETTSQEVVFHRQQLWFVLQLSLLCSSAVRKESPTDDDVRQFGECLLIANDILGQELNRKHEKLDDPENVRWFFAAFLPSFELNWHALGHADLARVQSIWKKELNQSSTAVQRIFPDKSVDQEFYNAYGITLRDFIEFAVALHFLLQRQIDKKTPLRVTKNALLQLLPESDLQCALSLISRTSDELTREIVLTPRQSWAVDFLPLRKYPIIRLSDEYMACPDLQLLESFFEESLYWLIAGAFPANQNEFRQLYGELFESHLNRVLSEFLYSGAGLATQLFTHPKFRSDRTEVCDALLDWPDTLTLIEYKATRFTRHQKYSGDSDTLIRAIDDAFAVDGSRARKGVGQLAESIQRLVAGDVISASTQTGSAPAPLNGRGILPVLVIAEPAMALGFVRDHLESKLREFLIKREVDQSCILPLLVLSHYQLECLEGYSEKASTEFMLRSYAQHISDRSAGLLDGFGDFISRRYGLTATSTATYMQRMRVEQLKQMKVAYQEKVRQNT